MNVIVLGAGAIGCWVGANVLRAGGEVTFIGRERFVAEANQHGLSVQPPDGDLWHYKPISAATQIEPEAAAQIEAVLLCTKAYAIPDAIRQLPAALSPSAWLVCLQNGVGTEATVAQTFGAARVIAATTTTPVSMLSPATIRVESLRGGIGLAPLDCADWDAARAQAFDTLSHVLAAKIYDSAASLKWSKLLLNLIGNATSAILDMPLDVMYRDVRLLDLEFAMLREALAVMRSVGARPMDLPGASAGKLAAGLRLPNMLLQPLLRGRFIKGRGDKKPSFYADVAQPSGQSEVVYLNGAVVEEGRRNGIATPVNATLTAVMLDLVTGRARAEDWRGQVDKLLAACGLGTP